MALLHEQGKLLLMKAKDDWAALNVLIEKSDIADEIIGFHAQQVIEKALKAILAKHDIFFKRTHDIVELLDLLNDNGIKTPPEIERSKTLTPFAVELRYDFLPPEHDNTGHLNREEIKEIVGRTLDWAISLANHC